MCGLNGGVQGAKSPTGIWYVPRKHGLKGVQGAKSPAGVWGVPSSLLLWVGGGENIF